MENGGTMCNPTNVTEQKQQQKDEINKTELNRMQMMESILIYNQNAEHRTLTRGTFNDLCVPQAYTAVSTSLSNAWYLHNPEIKHRC